MGTFVGVDGRQEQELGGGMVSELGAGAGLIKQPCLLQRSFLLMQKKKLGRKRDNLVRTTYCTKERGLSTAFPSLVGSSCK